MKKKIIVCILVSFFCAMPIIVDANTFNWYFSNSSGNDTTGDGTEGKPWKTLSKMQSQINTTALTDEVYIYLKRGDIWNIITTKPIPSSLYRFPSARGAVHINAYGNGDRPIINGDVTDWAKVPFDEPGNPRRWYRIFQVSRSDCSVKNLEIRNFYGNAIYLMDGAHSFAMTGNLIHNFGGCAIQMKGSENFTYNNTIAYNVIHTGQLLAKYERRPYGWEGAINLTGAVAPEGSKLPYWNHIHHNIIYDIFGEGIITMNSVIEWNLFGDTASVVISNIPHTLSPLHAIVRNNMVVGSNRATTEYRMAGQGMVATRIYDELPGGDNSQGTFDISGNIFINVRAGLFQYMTPAYMIHGGDRDLFKWADIRNNVIIDSTHQNIMALDPHTIKEYVNVINNSSIFFVRGNDGNPPRHIRDGDSMPHEVWSITGNHFWTQGKAKPVVPAAWQDNWNISDPQFLGQTTVAWTTQSGPGYWKAINPILHMNPPASSPIYNLTPLLTLDINLFTEKIKNYHNGQLIYTKPDKIDLLPPKNVILEPK